MKIGDCAIPFGYFSSTCVAKIYAGDEFYYFDIKDRKVYKVICGGVIMKMKYHLEDDRYETERIICFTRKHDTENVEWERYSLSNKDSVAPFYRSLEDLKENNHIFSTRATIKYGEYESGDFQKILNEYSGTDYGASKFKVTKPILAFAPKFHVTETMFAFDGDERCYYPSTLSDVKTIDFQFHFGFDGVGGDFLEIQLESEDKVYSLRPLNDCDFELASE